MNKLSNKLLGSLAAVALATLPAPATAANEWLSATTAEGCRIYWMVVSGYYTETTFNQGVHFSWSGNCEPGKLINGQGTLSQQMDEDNAGGSGASQMEFVGRLVDGVFDGPAAVYNIGSDGHRGAGKTYEHRMGCVIQNGQITNTCVPRTRLAASSSSAGAEADARFAAEQREYEQKLAAQQKAVAEFEAAQRQMAADKAAAAARASVAQEEFARQQAAYQAEQDRYARELAEYEAQLTGQPVAAQGAGTQPPLSTSGPGGSSVTPLRPTAALEAHNPANEASGCLDLIIKRDFEARGVSSIMGAVFRNDCPFPVETRWCIGASCARGYDNIATMPAKNDRGISYDAPAGVRTETRWAGCRMGFAYRPDFAGTLHYACK